MEDDHHPKRFATLQAHAALAGIALTRSANAQGDHLYVASKWALCKSFEDLNEVSTWLTQVTGKDVEAASK